MTELPEEVQVLLTQARLRGWPKWVVNNWRLRFLEDGEEYYASNMRQLRGYVADQSCAERMKQSVLAPNEEDKVRDASN